MDPRLIYIPLYIVMGFLLPSLMICLCAYACCRLRIYKSMGQWCRKEPRTDTDRSGSENSRSVQRKLIRTWKKYEKGRSLKERDRHVIQTVLAQDVISEICSVCWEDFAEVKKKEAMTSSQEKNSKRRPNHEFIGVVKSCGHYFHLDCLLIWMRENLICPMCRTYALLSDEYLLAIPLKSLSLKANEAPTTSGGAEKEDEGETRKQEHATPSTEAVVFTVSGNLPPGRSPEDFVISVG